MMIVTRIAIIAICISSAPCIWYARLTLAIELGRTRIVVEVTINGNKVGAFRDLAGHCDGIELLSGRSRFILIVVEGT